MEKDYNINPIVLIACVAEIVFLIIAGVIIKDLFTPKTKVNKIGIDNYANVNLNVNLDDAQKSVVEGELAKIVSLNNTDSSTLSYGAEIREGSVHDVFIDDLAIHFLNFIIDVKELGQSYQVIYRWADRYPNPNVPTNNSAMIFCPRQDKQIDQNFNCRDDYNGNGESIVAYQVLRNQLFGSFLTGIEGNDTDGIKKIYISPMDSEEATKDNAIKTLRDWLANLGFNLDDYQYEIRANDIL